MPRRSRRKRTRLGVGLDDAGEAAELGHHVGQRRALVDRQRAHRRTAELEHLADAGAGAHRRQRQQVQHHVLGGHARRAAGRRTRRAATRACVRRTAPVTKALAMSVRADAEGHAAERAGVRRVRIGADDQLRPAARSARPSARARCLASRCCRVAGSSCLQVAVVGQAVARDERAVRARQPRTPPTRPCATCTGLRCT